MPGSRRRCKKVLTVVCVNQRSALHLRYLNFSSEHTPNLSANWVIAPKGPMIAAAWPCNVSLCIAKSVGNFPHEA